MQENNPELNRENLGPEAGPEFYNEAQIKPEIKRTWPTEAEKKAHAEHASEIIGTVTEIPAPSEIEDIGLPAGETEKLRRDPKAWVNEAIGNKELSGYEKLEGLSEAMDLDKAA
jgi:hypothetical protein